MIEIHTSDARMCIDFNGNPVSGKGGYAGVAMEGEQCYVYVLMPYSELKAAALIDRIVQAS